jgi:3-oxoacyl-[acyl-carrier-protein] synthase-3
MAFFSFDHVKITGLSVVVPPKEINIYDEAQYYENNTKKIDRMRKKVGFFKRRIVDVDVTAGDLALAAGKKLLSSMNVDVNSIDGLIYVVQYNDYLGPMDAYILHHKLGLSESCIATNIQQGCVGWLFGMFTSSNFVETGNFKRVLLLTGDVPSVSTDIEDRNQAPLFGDAGTATLLEYSDDIVKSYFDVSTYSDGYDKIIVPGFGKKLRAEPRNSSVDPFNAPLFKKYETDKGFGCYLDQGILDSDAVFEFTMNKAPRDIKSLVEKANGSFNPEDFSLCCLHQANKQIVQTIGTLLGFPMDKVPTKAFEYFGNNTMCSIPTVLASNGAHEENDDLVGSGAKFDEKPYLCSAFGNGLATTSAILNLKDTVNCGISIFEKPSDWMNREQTFEFWINKIQGK